jgi:hypothetical protein
MIVGVPRESYPGERRVNARIREFLGLAALAADSKGA